MADYFKLENRFKMLDQSETATPRRNYLPQAQQDVNTRRAFYEFLAAAEQSEPAIIETAHEPNDHLSRL